MVIMILIMMMLVGCKICFFFDLLAERVNRGGGCRSGWSYRKRGGYEGRRHTQLFECVPIDTIKKLTLTHHTARPCG